MKLSIFDAAIFSLPPPPSHGFVTKGNLFFLIYNTTDEIGNSNEKLNNGVTYFQANLLTIYVFFHGKIGMYG